MAKYIRRTERTLAKLDILLVIDDILELIIVSKLITLARITGNFAATTVVRIVIKDFFEFLFIIKITTDITITETSGARIVLI